MRNKAVQNSNPTPAADQDTPKFNLGKRVIVPGLSSTATPYTRIYEKQSFSVQEIRNMIAERKKVSGT